MSTPATPLSELLQSLEPPLNFLAAGDFRRLDQTSLPLDAVGERLARARAAAPPGTEAALGELDEIVAALRRGAGGDAERLLRRAHGLVIGLRGGGAPAESPRRTPAPRQAPAPYRRFAGNVELALVALQQKVEAIKAVGPKRGGELERFGFATVEDVLYHLPFRYEDRRAIMSLGALQPGVEASAVCEVVRAREGVMGRRGRRLLEVLVRDGDAGLMLVWFNQLQYYGRRLQTGTRLLVHGRVEAPFAGGPPRMVHPDVTFLAPDEDPRAQAGVLAVYEKPTAMPVGAMRRIAAEAVAGFAERVPGVLPAEVAARARVVEPARALRYLHAPPPEADLESLGAGRSFAHRSLVFDELFFLQLGLALRRHATVEEPGRAFTPSTRLAPALRARLPFQPTGAQERALGEIAADLGRPHPMRRLLQGDVGSGKTLVALLAALDVVEAGEQVALMAPTELLAEQHFETVRPWLEPLGVETTLLTGGVKGRARREALAGLASGRIGLAVGTHALIQEGVEMPRLGLAIVDEQHRFGVMQRAALQRRGGDPASLDVLVMSATPIPRTLALTLYGDLAVSTLDELPPGRTPIRTVLHRESKRDAVHQVVRDEVAAGHQAYVVYPLVEESEKSDLKAATTMARELGEGPLAGLRLGLVHGRMKGEEKDAVMRRFKARELDVLVSTTVIEVGIDVPNATVIVIEHAERFGLAQLHQLRGRVGRGQAPGHCLLVAADWMSPESFERLRVLERSTDGFYIAEADLTIRGPGDFLGTRQAGMPPFRVANLVRDTALMTLARDEVERVLADDPTLARPESAMLRTVLRHRWRGRLELARVG